MFLVFNTLLLRPLLKKSEQISIMELVRSEIWGLKKGPYTFWSKTRTGSLCVFCGIHYSTSPGRLLCEQLFSCLLVIFISVELLSWPRATEFSWQHIWLSGLAGWAGEASGWQPRPLWQTFLSLWCNIKSPISPTKSVNLQLLSIEETSQELCVTYWIRADEAL